MAMSLEEKIAKAKETAMKKAEKDGLDEAATQALVEEAVAKVAAAKKPEQWVVTVNNNPTYCGIGAGGIQFANGQAVVTSERMADWFKEHSGYTVKES